MDEEPEYLPDVWWSRDFPVLCECVRRIDVGEQRPQCEEIGKALGFDTRTTQAAFNALKRRQLVDTLGSLQRPNLLVRDVAGQAYVITGAHPSPESAARDLLKALQAAEDRALPDERGKIARARDAVLGIGRDVLVDVMAGVIRGHVPM